MSEWRVNSFFQLILAIDATIFRNTIQVIGLSIFNGLFLVYAVIQVSSISFVRLEGLRCYNDPDG